MVFNEKDKYFFSIILKQGQVFEDVIHTSYEYDIKLEEAIKKNKNKVTVINKKTNEKHSFSFLPYGKYNEDTKTFTWFHDLQNKLMIDMINKGIIGNFYKDDSTIVKLFEKPEIKIPIEYKNVIPYFIAILYTNMNIIPFSSPNTNMTMYVGIAMNIKDNFDGDMYKEDLEKYYVLGKQKRSTRMRKNKKKDSKKNSKKKSK